MIVERRPGGAVGEHVLRYCAYEERTGAPTRQREPISTSVVLIFGLDTRLGVDGSRLGTFVGGLGEGCQWIEHDGAMAGVQVDVTPLGARMLLGVPMHELARRSVELEDVIGPEARVLEERLHEASSWEARFELIEAALERRLRPATPPPPDVAWAWRRLTEMHGRTRVHELAAALGCSRKHLAARFREHVGLPPKAVARVSRFRRAAELLLSPTVPSLDEVAFSCGYYDQAHLDRDFRDFAATTPSEYRRDPQAVTFFQYS
jgi:AraC-like DNA-binding protein